MRRFPEVIQAIAFEIERESSRAFSKPTRNTEADAIVFATTVTVSNYQCLRVASSLPHCHGLDLHLECFYT